MAGFGCPPHRIGLGIRSGQSHQMASGRLPHNGNSCRVQPELQSVLFHAADGLCNVPESLQDAETQASSGS